MSHTKKFIQEVSHKEGHNGDINEEVLKKAAEIILDKIKTAEILNKVNHEALLSDTPEKE